MLVENVGGGQSDVRSYLSFGLCRECSTIWNVGIFYSAMGISIRVITGHNSLSHPKYLAHSMDLDKLRAKQFLVVGLAKNCSKSIKTDITKVQSALKAFKHVQWLVIESDSRDRTVKKLGELEREIENFRFISLGALRKDFPLRTVRIAHCRNRYLDELSGNPIYAHIDYVIVADLDGVNDQLTEQALLSCWARDDWDVCTANQRGPYYDVWALRHKTWSPNDCWSQYKFLTKHGLSTNESLFAAIHSRMIKIDENLEWIEVDSSFGGLAIYRRKALEGTQYVGLDDEGEMVCEHVQFHATLKSKGGRIFINPKLINTGYTPHTRKLLLWSRVKRWIKGLWNIVITNPIKALINMTV